MRLEELTQLVLQRVKSAGLKLNGEKCVFGATRIKFLRHVLTDNVWKFKHITSSPKHPRSNGLAERYVQTAKNLLKKCNKDGSDLKLSLLMMRATPTENLPSPAERLFGRRIRTPITVAKVEATTNPGEVTAQLIKNRQRQKAFADRQSKTMPPLAVGDKVLVQEGPRKWFSGEVLKQHEAPPPRSFVVKMNDGKLLRRNTSHLKKSNAEVLKPRNRYETIMPQRAQATTVPHGPVTPIEQQRVPEAEPATTDTTEVLSRLGRRFGEVFTRFGRRVKPPERLDL
jgi:hypothetical protein